VADSYNPPGPQKPYFSGSADQEFNLRSMRKYIDQKQEMDKVLEKLAGPYLSKGSVRILDACCGIGHLIYHLRQTSPDAHFVGFDETPYLIEEARKLLGDDPRIQLEVDDLHKFAERNVDAFDVVICWKTLSWLPHYEDALHSLLKMTRSHIFISSLFYEGDIDYEIRIREHAKESGAQGQYTFHNIYSLPRFERVAREAGARAIESIEFSIGIDIPRPPLDHMGTYTIPLANGKNLQMSGALPMPWKIIHIEKR